MTRFSQLYLEVQPLAQDSQRMRVRVGGLFGYRNGLEAALVLVIEQRLGARVPVAGMGYNFTAFFENAALRDFLDTITLIYQLKVARRDGTAAAWLAAVAEVFAEERVRYRVDDQGVVHLAVDHEFERNRSATLAGLAANRYAAARAEFEAAFTRLSEVPSDGKLAIRAIFEANEILFKLAVPAAQRLGTAEVRQHLRPIVEARYNGDIATRRAALELLQGFSEWVEGMHWYRHGQGEEEPAQPPLEIAVAAVSLGAAHLRWMLDLLEPRE